MNQLKKLSKNWITKSNEWLYNNVILESDRIMAEITINQFKKRKRANDRIKVGFIVQMPQVWDKESPVYERMTADSQFDPWLIVVPSYDRALGAKKHMETNCNTSSRNIQLDTYLLRSNLGMIFIK